MAKLAASTASGMTADACRAVYNTGLEQRLNYAVIGVGIQTCVG